MKIIILFIFDYCLFSSLPYPDIFGGAGSFTRKHFELINGFSNEFWGWGGEDDDLFERYNYGILINKSASLLAVLHMRGHLRPGALFNKYSIFERIV